MSLKVYGVNLDGRHRCIVAAHSKKRAAELFGTNVRYLGMYGCETGNREEIRIATERPETVFKRLDRHGETYQLRDATP